MRFAALLALALSSCPPKPTPGPAPPADAGPFAACPNPSVVSSQSACDGMFTADGHACVNCVGNTGCLDSSLQVYGVAGGCAGDPNCALEPESGPLQGRRHRPP